MTLLKLTAPFPYFGGKSTIADIVWRALGQPKHYIEPFFGSGAVLLARPNYNPQKYVETVCDKDAHIANVWRALQFAPDEVAKVCDWPVNHADLSARKKFMIENRQRLLDNLISDPEWYDPKMAGYWIWAASCWIGSGLTRIGQRPHLEGGKGVHRIGQRPHLANSGVGLHRIGGIPPNKKEQKAEGLEDDTIRDCRNPYNENIYKWFRQLSERLRYVRVVCGDWTRVCGGNWQDLRQDVGIFFDPPYSVETRTEVYTEDDRNVAQKVADWCIERGKRSNYRIVLAGYYEEHERLLSHGWTVKRWKARGGYANAGKGKTQGKENRGKEALFFSPYCLGLEQPLLEGL